MTTSEGNLLTINGGSSSIKFALFSRTLPLVRILSGSIDRIGLSGSTFQVKDEGDANTFSRGIHAPSHKVALDTFMEWAAEKSSHQRLCAIGHRVVNGGPKYIKPVEITPNVIKDLRELSPFDPEHLPAEILIMEAFHKRFPKIMQIACFDTAFHHDIPPVARLLAIPRKYSDSGIRRYGFHGLSYAFLWEELKHLEEKSKAYGRVIFAHLGSGASLAAMLNGKSIDTTMSLTPTSGIPMGTRSGDLDPTLAFYLSYVEGMTAKEFNEMIHFKSGLLGISETSSDMQDLLKNESTDIRAAEAISLFCYQIRKCIGAYAAALGGLDTLVFAGGIGENSPTIRSRICEGLEFLGIEINREFNFENKCVISGASSRVTVRMIKTDEEKMIAQYLSHLMKV